MNRQRKMSFVNEVYDQFLVCRMCSKPYKKPRVLACMHSFCCKCLEDYYDMEEQDRSYKFLLYNRALSCPLCRQKTELPTGGISRLPENTLLENLGNVVKKNLPPAEGDVKWCDICRINNENSNIAVSKCLDCLKHLCTSCWDLHLNTKVTQFHAIIDLQIEKTVQCKLHEGELIKYFCESCDECICTLCAFHQHKQHDVCLLADVLDKNKLSFNTMLEDCNAKVEDLKNQVDFIDWCDASIKCTENKIRESVTETIVLMRQKEREMISSIREVIGQEVIEFLNQKEALEENLIKLENTFKNTSSTADNVELLLAKKHLQMHLSEISKDPVINFDRNLTRDYSIFKNKDHFETIRNYINMLSLQKSCLKPLSFVSAESKDTQTDKIELIDEKQHKSLAIVKPLIKTEEKSTEYDFDTKSSKPPASTWQKSLLRIEVENNIIPVNRIFLKPSQKRFAPTTRDNFTAMETVTWADKTTFTNQVTQIERSTGTMQVMVMHKNVATVTQKTTDKSTCTSSDVSIVARAMPSIQKQITVNRGTNTNPVPIIVKATSPRPSSDILNKKENTSSESSTQTDDLNILKANNGSYVSVKPIEKTPNQPSKTSVISDANINANNAMSNSTNTNNKINVSSTNNKSNGQYKYPILKLPGSPHIPSAKVAFLSGKLQNQRSPIFPTTSPLKSPTKHPLSFANNITSDNIK